MWIHKFAAVVIALAVSACSSNGAESPDVTTSPSSSATQTQSGIDAAFDDLGGFTITTISPTDFFWSGLGINAEYEEVNAAEIIKDGTPIMKVLVGQVNSGTGEDLIDQYFAKLNAMGEKLDPPKILAAGPPQDLGGYPVTYFHMYQSAEGFAYSDGPTVVIAERFAQGTPETVEDTFVKILNNVRRV